MATGRYFNFILAVTALSALSCSVAVATPSGVHLGRELSADDFLHRESEFGCVRTLSRKRGYWFTEVAEGEHGVAFGECELGKISCDVGM